MDGDTATREETKVTFKISVDYHVCYKCEGITLSGGELQLNIQK